MPKHYSFPVHEYGTLWWVGRAMTGEYLYDTKSKRITRHTDHGGGLTSCSPVDGIPRSVRKAIKRIPKTQDA